ncbi:MAG TPA: cbb3-type cytochrome c oxidase subunit I [Candidatus Saccharibacteria bacterium]|nr:cbb3-type cytochrome c oxidase subunit I [Candidatus Saccharibacteria bacterium]HRK94663.1 cbb3-type cytochrome c oxidase subunit I [Candidatus Saccharibacteria bacterium]
MIDFLLGRLSTEYFPSDPVTIGAAVGMPLTVVGLVALITYLKRWKWLWNNWLTSLDAKKIGVMYVIVAIIMLVRGVADAGMLRLQTALAAGDATGPFSTDTFQQVFTAHGTIMIFFVAMGLMFGLINVVMPLMIGARDMAFPFLNSISLWLFVAGMILVNTSLVFGGFSNGGWLGYPPLTELQYNPGPGVDYWIWSLQIAGIGSLLSGINFAVTIIKHRAPGMTWFKMPIFPWSVLVTSVLIMLAFPILTVTLALLSLDRTMGMHFFTSDLGGNAMMYINLIWAWGHPEVYILVLPAFGIYSEVVATFAKKALFGYKTMVYALIAIMFLSFVVWQHHFFTMGAGANVNAFFGIMTMVIAIPTGVKIFNWLFTMYRGRIRFRAPMVWFLAFVVTFTIGGVTGVMMAVPALDFQVHNSMFLVAHFHNTIIGGVVFGFFAAMTYWFPKIFGFRLNDRLGRYSAIAWQIGFIVAFMPLYALGLMGAVRRIDSYSDPTWQPFFITSGIGVLIIALGIGLFMLQIIYSVWKRKELRDTTGDPWDGRTLEWSVPSPAPHYNFAVQPVVTHRDEWWHRKKTHYQAPHKSEYRDVWLPKNSAVGLLIGLMACGAGFGIIWHLWWLVGLLALGIIVIIIIRTTKDDTEYLLTAEELLKEDRRAKGMAV